jgi:hypothetical protein
MVAGNEKTGRFQGFILDVKVIQFDEDMGSGLNTKYTTQMNYLDRIKISNSGLFLWRRGCDG